MSLSELIAAGYFIYLLVPIALSPIERSARLRLAGYAVCLVAAIAAFSFVPDSRGWHIARAWAPCGYLLAGYWLPGRLYTRPNQPLEQWLLALDVRVADPVGHIPRWFREYLEFTYLLCYPLVPATFSVLFFSDVQDVSFAADRFWSVVLLAVFVCYGLLPWIPTRPPRAIEKTHSQYRSTMQRMNMLVLRHASIQVNTFPSGHVAAAVASALAIGRVLPIAGVIVGILAVSIAIASVVGRYHYGADAVLGAFVALAASALIG